MTEEQLVGTHHIMIDAIELSVMVDKLAHLERAVDQWKGRAVIFASLSVVMFAVCFFACLER